MAKRPHEDSEGARPPKRVKPEQTQRAPVVEEVQFARQLQEFLAFRQDGVQQLRNGIASFKAFLESILYHKNEDDRGRELSILREYLDSQKPSDPKNLEDRPFLSQLWQAWSFANQNNNDYLASAVSAVVTLLLRTLSSLLDFRDHGILLCRTVLQHQHLRLIRRCLDAPKHKDFVISPCLRLLIEVVSFDGGALSNEVYKRREQTFDTNQLRRNLSLVRTDVSDEDAKRRPSIRTLTLRYVLAHLKYLHVGGKIDILRSRPLCVSVFHNLPDDPSDIVNELLAVTEQHVLNDSELPKSAKATLLVQHNLERVVEVASRSRADHPSADRAFAWLKAVCTKSSYGALRPSGWYPAGTTAPDDTQANSGSLIDLGLDSLDFYDRHDRPEVRNPTLLGWAQTLRPHLDQRERELVTTCFEAAPELVAAYFDGKNMQLEPKLSNTWIGYASFLFEVIRLPTPAWFGNTEAEGFAELPPQTRIIIENILPRPLTQKILTRCLNQSSDLITFFAIRLLIIAFQKLSGILAAMREASTSANERKALWLEAEERLLTRFMERSPSMKDVVAALRKMPDDDQHAIQREAVTRLLRLYYEVTPVHALEEQFDGSAALTAALDRDGEQAEFSESKGLRGLELEHLLVMARHNPGMRWFGKHGGLQYSPIVSLLRIHMNAVQNSQIRRLLSHVLEAHDIIADDRELEALLASFLKMANGDAGYAAVWMFVDDCIARVSRQPVKYVDQLEEAISSHESGSQEQLMRGLESYESSNRGRSFPGLLAVAVVEQVAFVTEKPIIVAWAYRYMQFLRHGKETSVSLQALGLRVPHIRDGNVETPMNMEALLEDIRLQHPASNLQHDRTASTEAPTLPFTAPALESDDHPELLRWAQKDLGLAIEDGDIAALILCLCSKHTEVRRQAHIQLCLLFAQLRDASLDDAPQLSVLVGELVETFEQQCSPEEKPLPHLAGTFATRALKVLAEPTHCIYPKLNRYMNKNPEWRILRMPAHWLSNTMLSQPTEDDAYWKEVRWVVEWLVEGLRSPTDLDILRRSGTIQKVMALYSSPAAERLKWLRETVMEMLYRTTCIDGGSTTLITRLGVLAWLDMVGDGDGVAGLLKARILETAGKERVERWSGMSVEHL
ncbi:hypothetical protein BAUCODRAFT_152069 [Baudoinia panamericana UAMH 10762]|uniref:Nucleolar pre-ribosomal-associated protein 1 C-terminal domain-containing protein n=1 Tax=Baudoinia panamericana (strain UAMH 10762) TaxID=717646 RepID=M2MZB6_BAUPA|nr:uncharacterized protein BAUCODRAFT_152069 [Baudoinia panamericana UAMH 10762]EMC91675.1 hypothetical protein BAUCODRAFT_152069 [Baudoinia panamericana UAMH 10762]